MGFDQWHQMERRASSSKRKKRGILQCGFYAPWVFNPSCRNGVIITIEIIMGWPSNPSHPVLHPSISGQIPGLGGPAFLSSVIPNIPFCAVQQLAALPSHRRLVIEKERIQINRRGKRLRVGRTRKAKQRNWGGGRSNAACDK